MAAQRLFLVTGGAGFIGSNVAEGLVKRGDRVRVFDNFCTGKRDNLAAAGDVELVEGDLRDPEACARVTAAREVSPSARSSPARGATSCKASRTPGTRYFRRRRRTSTLRASSS